MIQMEQKMEKLTWEIESKSRKIENLKRIKKSLSEQALKKNIEENLATLARLRISTFKYMRKFKGPNEDDNMDETAKTTYSTQNMLLSEYEEMLKEIQSMISFLYKKKARKVKEIKNRESRMGKQSDKIQSISEDIEYLLSKKEQMEIISQQQPSFQNQDYL